MRAHLAEAVLMVPPDDFAFNEQTARDNDFQHRPVDASSLRTAALAEFAAAVQALRSKGVAVVTLAKQPDTPLLPDAVFPNNWFSTWPDGRIWLYPMRTANRQAELRPAELTNALAQAGYRVSECRRLPAAPGQALEGTGALVFDHVGKKVYAARSERCDSELVRVHAAELGYEPLLFDTRGSTGRPFYHSNVMLSVGEGFAVACLDALPDPTERQALTEALQSGGRELVELTLAQTEQGFCANLLQLKTGGSRVIALSQTAYDRFDPGQRERLGRHGQLLPLVVPTIEQVGGGSVRCMLAELFLPRA